MDVDRTRATWWAVGGLLAAVVCFVVYSFVGTFVFGVFVYYATRPIYRRLRRRIYPPSLAAAVAILALAFPALALATYALLVAARELMRLTDGAALDPAQYLGLDPDLVARLSDPSRLAELDLQQYLDANAAASVLGSLQSAVDSLAVLGVAAVHLFVILALAFYLLRDDHRLARWTMSRFGDDRGVLAEFLRAVDTDFKNIFFGNILNAILTGTIGVIAYLVLNEVAPAGHPVPAPALVGLLAGVASLIPVVGMKLVYVPVALYMTLRAVVAGDPNALWFVLTFASVSFVVVDTIPDLVLRPYVSGRTLHVGAVMLAYTLGPLLFGWYGIFLLPMLLVVTVQFARVVLPELLEPTPIRPYTVDPGYLVDGVDPDRLEHPVDADAPADSDLPTDDGDGPSGGTDGP
jgi:predicted PurR-regulated permease PerM